MLCTGASEAASSKVTTKAPTKVPAKVLPKVIKKDFQVQTKDSRVIKATLSYIKIDGIKKYPTVFLLHSIGYSSEDWSNLPKDLNKDRKSTRLNSSH